MFTNAGVLDKSTRQYSREDYYEEFKRTYEKSHIDKIIYQYLDCGIFHNGFARVKCSSCKHEYLLAFSCKIRHFCPSYHAKKYIEFGEFLCTSILKKVPHRHFVFFIPKIL